MKQTIIVMLSILLLLLTSCQPTPQISEQSVDYSEESDNGTNQILNSTPSTFENHADLTDGIRLEVSADIKLPNAPLCTANIKRYAFDLNIIEKIAGVLFGDAQVYEYAETKEELLDYSATVKAQIGIAKETLSDASIASIENIIANMDSAMPQKPDEERPGDLRKILSYKDSIIEVDTGKERKANFRVVSDDRRQIISFSDYGFKRRDGDETSFVDLYFQEITKQTRGCNSLCTINAITGKRIDRGLGY